MARFSLFSQFFQNQRAFKAKFTAKGVNRTLYLAETALRGNVLLAANHATRTQLDTLSAAKSRTASTSRPPTPQMMTRALLVVLAQAAQISSLTASN